MNKILWPLVGFCVLVSLYWIFTGIGPKAIPVVKPSNFQSPEQLAETIYKQLYPRIMNYKVFAIGKEDNRSEQDIVSKKLSGLIADGFNSKVTILSDTPIKKEDFESKWIEVLYLNDIPEGERRQKINQIYLGDSKLIFLLSTFDAAHFRREAMINVVEQALQFKGLSFVMSRIALNPDELTIGNLCVPAAKDQMNYNPLACLVRLKSINISKSKKVSKEKMISAVERQGEHDFMIYTWVPQSN